MWELLSFVSEVELVSTDENASGVELRVHESSRELLFDLAKFLTEVDVDGSLVSV